MYERWDSKATFSSYKSQTWKKWNLINIGLSFGKNKSRKNILNILSFNKKNNCTMKYYVFRHGHRATHLKFHSKQFITQCIPLYLTLDILSKVLGVILHLRLDLWDNHSFHQGLIHQHLLYTLKPKIITQNFYTHTNLNSS
jgi:hypothetical protein